MEQPDATTKEFFEWFGSVLLLLLTIGGQAWRYIRESTKDEPPVKHAVFEAAELADMQPLRIALQKLDRLLEIEADVEQVKRDSARMLELLERMDREDEIARRAADLAQRIVVERRGNPPRGA